eukprot:TRINITY_DN25846_c0_g1_i1.p1 TRINITY_DN25846_c0_g1~~TRINITY_DN25846_c0_g1_i1.p1  ORF type:complete len:393 (+),score=108.50 TRINITY_DN25846_c0_g1_i1:70-1179(+)
MAAQVSGGPFVAEQLEEGLWKVVQDDQWKEYPFMYLLVGPQRIVVVDTGAPVGSAMTFKAFVDAHLNPRKLPYYVVCTHVHFDHTGGAHAFSDAGCPVAMCGASRVFSENWEINSLANGRQFTAPKISHWLADSDAIPVDDSSPDHCLDVIHTPGHTPDSICLYSRKYKRLFVADVLYPFTAVNVDGLGSNVADYVRSLVKLRDFVARVGGAPAGGAPPAAAPTPQPAAQQLPAQCRQFLETVGLTEQAVSTRFCVRSLLQLCDDSVEQAVNMYLTSPDTIGEMVPPPPPPVPAAAPAAASTPGVAQSGVLIAGGHVEPGMPADSIDQALALLEAVRAGAVMPSQIDDGFGEFTNGQFSFMLPLTPKWE